MYYSPKCVGQRCLGDTFSADINGDALEEVVKAFADFYFTNYIDIEPVALANLRGHFHS